MGDRPHGAEPDRALEQRTDELRALRAEIDAFVNSISHDLRGPLMHIGGFTDLLTEHSGAKLDETGREYLRTIRTSADELARLLAEILTQFRASRAEQDRTRASVEPRYAGSNPPLAAKLGGMKSPKFWPPGTVPRTGTRTEKIIRPPAAMTLRILLLEDCALDVALITHALNSSGREVALTHVDTREAFETELRCRAPQLILSDYSLPTFNGGQALEIAQRLAPGLPFIFVTGSLGEELAIDMLKLGATDYVLKNRLARLLPAVNRALSETEQQHARVLAEEKLRHSHEQLRALTAHLQAVREEERTRTARELHDELGQALVGLKTELAGLAGDRTNTRALQPKIQAVSAHLDDSIMVVDRLATELRPDVLDRLGLVAALEWQAAEFQARTGVRCETNMAAMEKISEQNFITVCFRIFQEALANIQRDGTAALVEVRLQHDDHKLVLSVSDDGRGTAETELSPAHSIRLSSMRERATQVGGEVFIDGKPGRGTTVTLRVPLPTLALSSAEGT